MVCTGLWSSCFIFMFAACKFLLKASLSPHWLLCVMCIYHIRPPHVHTHTHTPTHLIISILPRCRPTQCSTPRPCTALSCQKPARKSTWTSVMGLRPRSGSGRGTTLQREQLGSGIRQIYLFLLVYILSFAFSFNIGAYHSFAVDSVPYYFSSFQLYHSTQLSQSHIIMHCILTCL